MSFLHLDPPKVAQALGQVAAVPGDLADAYFERREEVELPPEGESPGVRVWREEGLAVRLLRGERAWLASRDGLSSDLLARALRQVARTVPQSPQPAPRLESVSHRETVNAEELLAFPAKLKRCLRELRLELPVKLELRRHRRWIQVVGRELVADSEDECFYSCSASLPSGSTYGTLLPAADDEAAEQVAARLVARDEARDSPSPDPYRGVVVLGPDASAVFFHEAVAHVLEADTLVRSGDPQAAIGVQMGGPFLDLLDDPASAPEGVRRRADDEGVQVLRRWLLRAGIVEQPLADSRWAKDSTALAAGAARRSSRHLPPVPRSTHLELLPGEQGDLDLRAEAEGGLYIAEASRGSLDALTGAFRLSIPYARRISGGKAAKSVGAFRLTGQVKDLLASITAVGSERWPAGAGWCAKGGHKLPVWATMPSIRLEGVEIRP